MTPSLQAAPISELPGGLAATEFAAIGTTARLIVTDPSAAAAARDILVAELDALDLACSRFRPDSELATVVDGAAGAPVRVSPLLAEVVAAGLRGAEITNGDLDPTVADAMAAVGYDRTFTAITDDKPAIRVSYLPAPGWRTVVLEGDVLTVPAGVRIDLGATAKAFCSDRSANRIAAELGCGVLVSLGGDIAVAGPAPEAGWTIRVQDLPGDPDATPDGPSALITLFTGGLATSSTAARRWQRGGQWMHHILDPRTGTPVNSPWRTVTVAAGTCVDANIASTTSIIRGYDAPAWLEGMGLPARFVDNDGRVRAVGPWPEEAEQ
jgi:thiamine biosynthesis lipoprotein ApbE